MQKPMTSAQFDSFLVTQKEAADYELTRMEVVNEYH